MPSDTRKPPLNAPCPELRANIGPAFAAAMIRAGQYPIVSLEISNSGKRFLRDCKLRMSSSPGLFCEQIRELPVLAPGASLGLDPHFLHFPPGLAWAEKEPRRVVLSFSLLQGFKETSLLDHPLTVYPYDWWPGLNISPESLAAFVRPDGSWVEDLTAGPRKGFPDGPHARSLEHHAVTRLIRELTDAIRKTGIRLVPAESERLYSGLAINGPEALLRSLRGTPLDLALLFCACMEKCGLHPLIFFTKAAALVGCHLEGGLLPTAAGTDEATLGHVSSGRILAFDPVIANSPIADAFDRACEVAGFCLEESFSCVVDVARARLLRTRPLPPAPEASGFSGMPEAPLALTPDILPPLPSQAEDKLEAWPRRLLDLSLRNPLINFRPGSGFIPVMTANPGKLEDRLADGICFTIESLFPYLPEEVGKKVAKGEIDESGLRAEVGSLLSRMRPPRIYVPLRQAELKKRLLHLYRSARLALEEGGVSTLYMVFGFLAWLQEGEEASCLAPIMLVPVTLRREQASAGFTLEQSDDGPRFNLTLLELLRTDHGITELDSLATEIPLDLHGADIDGILDSVRAAVARRLGWEVREEVGIGLFSFAKHLMWKDLVDNRKLLAETPVIRHLLQEGRGEELPPPSFPAPEKIDTKAARSSLFCPLPADSSQLAAVSAALSGANFIMVGPPGTGKSQTIANMIVQCIASGKSVLFVAEKSAALQVVYSRLRQLGMADLCLELHSSKTRKADVLRQLGRSAAALEQFPESEWNKALSRFANAAARLNAYARSVNQAHEDGLTPNTALAAYAASRELAERLTFPVQAFREPEDLPSLLQTAANLARHGREISKLATTGLRHIRRTDWSAAMQKEIVAAAERLASSAERLHTEGIQLFRHFGLPDGTGEYNLPFLEPLMALLPEAWGKSLAFVLREDLPDLLAGMKDGLALISRYATLRDGLSCEYTPDALAEGGAVNDPEIRDTVMRAQHSSWFLPRFWHWKKAGRLLSRYVRHAQTPPDAQADLPLLEQIISVRQQLDVLGTTRFSGVFPDLWQGADTDAEALSEALAFASAFYRLKSALQERRLWCGNLESAVTDLLRDKGALLSSDAGFSLFARTYMELLEAYNRESATLAVLLDSVPEAPQASKAMLAVMAAGMPENSQRLPGSCSLPGGYKNRSQLCREIILMQDSMRPWCMWRDAVAEAGESMQDLAEAIEIGLISPGEAEQAFLAYYASARLSFMLSRDKALSRFSAAEQEDHMDALRAAGEKLRLLSISCARGKRRAPGMDLQEYREEWRLLRRELMKKSRHLPIRQLLAGVPHLLRLLTPCLFMSPLSVAQYLSTSGPAFDIVIFDEASQIPVWDALGALARARSAVIVGDPMQLPPTSFFQRSPEDIPEEDLAAADQESILKQCIASGMPEMRLLWHYRSRHESLISFSNRKYYDNSLVTFPSPAARSTAVTLHRIQGVYGRGGSRTNPKEAQHITSHLVATLRSYLKGKSTPRSIGVVTFNSQQQQLVENLLDQKRRDDPSLDVFFNSETAEPVFVKNIENIQGDERDIIFFSLCYGPDAQGGMSLNFGALNTEGGERRLNVALTRARMALHVYASFDPDAIARDKTNSRGLLHLRDFMEYARSGSESRKLTAAGAGSMLGEERSLASVVADELRRRGWRTHLGVGSSAGSVDIAVVNPDSPEFYLAGILCDGASYAFFSSAQDRDDVRASVLEGLGWSILHAWSMDWYFDRKAADTLHERLRSLLEKEKEYETTRRIATVPDISPEVPDQPAQMREDKAPMPRQRIRASRTGGPITLQQALTAFDSGAVARIVHALVQQYSPIHEEVLCKEVLSAKVITGKSSPEIRREVVSYARKAYKMTREETGCFFWKSGDGPEHVTAWRENRSPFQGIKETAMPLLRRLAESLPFERGKKPVRQMSLALGYARLSKELRDRLDTAWETRESK